ncbi:dihydrodipicolinate synthase family protein [Sanguibacter massiliensis]|uniref:dihydrodipicolinate synthase family protein n=1 Tax=Sanguibacter massiliensis TaxID=1973217 RepID=UPI000C839A27|nr:dihydrodipicolinate synthase family protein [Sanguibacter massiliensis]
MDTTGTKRLHQVALHGLVAYLPTPVRYDEVDLAAFGRLVERAVAAGADALGVLGSTGAAMYLDRDERHAVVRRAVDLAAGVPVVAGVSALRTAAAQEHADDAQSAGASALLLAPVGYVPLVGTEAVGLFEDVLAGIDVPLVVYDNPATTRVDMSTGLLVRLAALPGVGSVKTPGPGPRAALARARVAELRAALPLDVSLGFSGDDAGAAALRAGADAWHSTLAGTLPELFVPLARAASLGAPGADPVPDDAGDTSHLAALWDLVRRHTGVRVASTTAELLGLVGGPSLPRPLLPLAAADRDALRRVLAELGVL